MNSPRLGTNKLAIDTSTHSNATTTETIIGSFTPAHGLLASGDAITFDFAGTMTLGGKSVTFKVYVGTTVILNTGSVAMTGTQFRCVGAIAFTSNTAAVAHASFMEDGGTTKMGANSSCAGLNLSSGSLAVKITATVATGIGDEVVACLTLIR